MGRRDPAFLTSFLYFFSFFSHFLDAETICLEVIFILMSSSCRETRWPMVLLCRARRRLGKSAGGVLSVEPFLAAVRLVGYCEVWLDWLERSGRVR